MDVVRFYYTLVGFDENFKLSHPKNYDDFQKRIQELEYFDFLMWNMIIKKELYLKCFEFISKYNLNKTNIIEDVIFNFILNSILKDYYVIDDRLYKYYKNNNSMTNIKTKEHIKNIINTKEYTLEFFKYLHKQYPNIFSQQMYYAHYFMLYFSIINDKIQYNNMCGFGLNNIINMLYFKVEKRKLKKLRKEIINNLKEKNATNINNITNL